MTFLYRVRGRARTGRPRNGCPSFHGRQDGLPGAGVPGLDYELARPGLRSLTNRRWALAEKPHLSKPRRRSEPGQPSGTRPRAPPQEPGGTAPGREPPPALVGNGAARSCSAAPPAPTRQTDIVPRPMVRGMGWRLFPRCPGPFIWTGSGSMGSDIRGIMAPGTVRCWRRGRPRHDSLGSAAAPGRYDLLYGRVT